MTKEELKAFSDEIGQLFNDGKILCPVHLSYGNEEQLLRIFEKVSQNDWILSTWRSHSHYLCSGRDKEELKKQIMEGHSMHIFGHRFYTSAIVGGIAPIAVGIGYALKQKKDKSLVWCFLGDMGASTGIAMESIRYACGNDLPVRFVIEDNQLSVKTKTRECWGCTKCEHGLRDRFLFSCDLYDCDNVRYYRYERVKPHAGNGGLF